MKTRSLGLRLLFAAGLSTFVALVVTAFAISYLFELYFQKRLADELSAELTELTAAVSISAEGKLGMKPLSDLRYSQPYSGRYWQVEAGEVVFSRSLWDQPLKVTLPGTMGAQKTQTVRAPFGGELLTLSWQVSMDNVADGEAVLLTVAADLSELTAASIEFRTNIAFWLGLLGIALVAASWLQVRIGLRPLEQIRTDVERVTYQPGTRLPEDYPAEVRPLAITINSLLDRQSATLDAARRRAGDLAHGLKTPLTVLAAHAADIRTDGKGEAAEQIEQQLAAMRLFVERELARSRASLSRSESSEVGPIAEQMVAAIKKMPGADGIEWSIDVPKGLRAPFDAHDLSELLGNLLDNARKYAKSCVQLRCEYKGEDAIAIVIQDDGPGIPPGEVEQIIEAGVQGSSSAAGQGLGLAIVRDLLALNNCTIEFENPDPIGLRIIVTWACERQPQR